MGKPRRRRSRAEAEQLVAEYEASGISQEEFCQRHGMALSTLARYRKWRRQEQRQGTQPGRWVAVELSPPRSGDSGLVVVLASGRRVEVGRGFDTQTLAQLMRVLEPA